MRELRWTQLSPRTWESYCGRFTIKMRKVGALTKWLLYDRQLPKKSAVCHAYSEAAARNVAVGRLHSTQAP